jgi:hypothetical protein
VLYLRESGPICREIIEPEELAVPSKYAVTSSARAPAPSCPRCGGDGLWTGKRCTRCGVFFRCRDPRCSAVYNEQQITSLRWCSHCDVDYSDLPPWPPPAALDDPP